MGYSGSICSLVIVWHAPQGHTCNAPIETESLQRKCPLWLDMLRYVGQAQSCRLLPEPPLAQTSPENAKSSGQEFVVAVVLKNICSSQCLVSLGIWHRAVKLYMVHHLLQYLPGYRKLKVLEERLPSQSKCLRPGRSQRWGWACQVQTLIQGFVWLCYRSDAVVSGKGLWAGPPCSFLPRSRLSGARANCDLKFQVRACLTTQPTHENGSEVPDTSGCLSCLDIYWVLPHKILWEKTRLRISLLYRFFPLKTVRLDQSITQFDKEFVNLSRPGLHCSL